MPELFGWVGKILRVDLTTGKTSLTPTTEYIPRFVGGRGVADKIYWDEILPQVKAFDPANKLIFMTGPASGTLAPQSGRLSLVSKSPQGYPDDCYYCSNCGGYIAQEIKRAGYDGIIIEGRSPKPSYVYIKDDKVELRDASQMAGLGFFDKQRMVYGSCGNDAEIMGIGPAGEHLNRDAAIISGLKSAMGQGGFGAVMGSKNLLAIAVKGTAGVKVAKPQELIGVFNNYTRAITRKETEMQPFDATTDLGEKAHYRGKVHKARSSNYYKSLDELRGTEIEAEIEQGLAKFKFRACSACPVACLLALSRDDHQDFMASCMQIQSYNNTEMSYYGTKPIGPVTRNQAMLGNDMGVSQYDAGGYSRVIQLMTKAGLLNPDNSGGLPVDKRGSKEYITQLWENIGHKKGLGVLLTQGLKRFLLSFGEEGRRLYQLTYRRKGNTVATPQLATKAQTILNLIDPKPDSQFWFTLGRPTKKFVFDMKSASEEERRLIMAAGARYFGSELAMDETTWEYKPLVARIYSYYHLIIDSLPACTWATPCWYDVYTDDHIGDIGTMAQTFSSVTGIQTSDSDIRIMGERIHNLERAIAVREGRTRQDDWLYDSVFDQMHWNEADKQNLRQAVDEYYEQSGWDSTTGWPTKAKLRELDLKDVADDLEKMGKLP